MMRTTPHVAHRLLEAADSARELFSLSPDDKLKLLGPFSRIAPMLDVRELDKTEEELSRLKENNPSQVYARLPYDIEIR